MAVVTQQIRRLWAYLYVCIRHSWVADTPRDKYETVNINRYHSLIQVLGSPELIIMLRQSVSNYQQPDTDVGQEGTDMYCLKLKSSEPPWLYTVRV